MPTACKIRKVKLHDNCNAITYSTTPLIVIGSIQDNIVMMMMIIGIYFMISSLTFLEPCHLSLQMHGQ